MIYTESTNYVEYTLTSAIEVAIGRDDSFHSPHWHCSASEYWLKRTLEGAGYE